jgi:hypothetical protein
MSVNHLILSTKKDEDVADDLLMALTSIASAGVSDDSEPPITRIERMATEREAPKKKKKKRKLTVGLDVNGQPRRSRFFYEPTKSLTEVIQESKAISEPRSLPNENAEIDGRIGQYARELPPVLMENITAIREYFLHEVAPKALASQAGTAQFMDVAQRTLGTAIDPKPMAQFERMVEHAQLIRMSKFVAKYMGLPVSTASTLAEAVTPKKEMMIFHPTQEERHVRPQKVQKDEEN